MISDPIKSSLCSFCNSEYDTGYNSEYCSEDCCFRSKGRSILNLIKYDHRFCNACFAKLKEIERPTDEQLRKIRGKQSAEALIGYQYRTQKSDIGEITIKKGTIDNVVTGTVCGECGTTDHRDNFQRSQKPSVQASQRLNNRINETRSEGQHSHSFSPEIFAQAWDEDSADWELAIGKALDNDRTNI